jgi:beta-glucosidase
VDDPVKTGVVDVEEGFELAQHVEEQSIVLLKNEGKILPLDAGTVHTVAVIGAHADLGMISGGGSAQVDPPGGNVIAPPGKRETTWQTPIWFPTSPLKALHAELPQAKVEFSSGEDRASAAALARNADVAIVFAYQWETEDQDLPNLSLPDKQDALIAEVAAANPRTIVVLETGGPVTMPWIDKVAGVVEAWYAGSRGHLAVARVLLGEVNPTAKLAVTFPRSERDLPHPTIPPIPTRVTNAASESAAATPEYSVPYDEGLKVGYKWYDAENKPVLFPFGYGLSYTTYQYSALEATPGATARAKTTLRFAIKNTGDRAGAEIAEVYVTLPASAEEPPRRLVGWTKVPLNAGESHNVAVEIDPTYLQVFDEQANAWKLVPGDYGFAVGGSSRDLPLKKQVTLR